MRAFRLALDERADGIELDVRLCATGEVVVVHDPTLARVAGRDVRVRTTSLADLRACDVGEGERVPVLDEVLDLVFARRAFVNVELKGDDADRRLLAQAIARCLNARAVSEHANILLSTFYVSLLGWLGAHRSPCATALLVDRPSALVQRHVIRPTAIHLPHRLATTARISRFRSEGRVVNVWTVDERSEVLRVAAAGADGIITNDVRNTRAALLLDSGVG